MVYNLLVTVHLLAAIAFVGAVFFEVVILESAQARLPLALRLKLQQAIGNRAVQVMPWVLLTLYSAGIAMAWQYRSVLEHPLASQFGLLLAIKIVLAFCVLLHFATAMLWRKRGKLAGKRSRYLHISVFCHVLAIVILAKLLHYPPLW